MQPVPMLTLTRIAITGQQSVGLVSPLGPGTAGVGLAVLASAKSQVFVAFPLRNVKKKSASMWDVCARLWAQARIRSSTEKPCKITVLLSQTHDALANMHG